MGSCSFFPTPQMPSIPDTAACTSNSAVALVPLTPKCCRPVGPRHTLCIRWVYTCCAVLSCSAMFPSFLAQNASVFIVCEVLLFPRSPSGTDVCVCMCACMRTQLLNCVQLFAIPSAIAHQVPLSMKFPSKNPGVDCHFLFQGIFLTQGLSPFLMCLLPWQQITELPGNLIHALQLRNGELWKSDTLMESSKQAWDLTHHPSRFLTYNTTLSNGPGEDRIGSGSCILGESVRAIGGPDTHKGMSFHP